MAWKTRKVHPFIVRFQLHGNPVKTVSVCVRCVCLLCLSLESFRNSFHQHYSRQDLAESHAPALTDAHYYLRVETGQLAAASLICILCFINLYTSYTRNRIGERSKEYLEK